MYPYQGFDVVEVWNGQWTSEVPRQADNEAALAEWGRGLAADILRGRWRPAMGNSDTHLADQIGIPHAVVLAGEPSADTVLAGIRNGRSWIAASTAVDLSLQARDDGGTEQPDHPRLKYATDVRTASVPAVDKPNSAVFQ